MAEARKELSYLDKSSKSRQQVYLMEEDTLIRFTGYKTLVGNQIIYSIVCCLTLGIVYLFGRWLPRFRSSTSAKRSSSRRPNSS